MRPAPSAQHLLITFVPTVLTLVVLAAISEMYAVPMADITRDMAQIGGIHPLSGILSNLGIILWCATAATCLFSALVLRSGPSDAYYFLLSSAGLSAALLIDDFFAVHDFLAERYLHIDEKVVIAALGVATVVLLVAFRPTIILKTHYRLLLLAPGFFAISVGADAFDDRLWRLGQWQYLLEDGAKWLGIAGWCSYYVVTSYQLVTDPASEPVAATVPTD